jgi:hypothetical protein
MVSLQRGARAFALHCPSRSPQSTPPMRLFIAALVLGIFARSGSAQATGKFPPDSLMNTHIIPRNTAPTQVWGMMRNYAAALGVECTHCHVGRSGSPLAEIDFISDEKRTKLVARQMMRMVTEINRRLDTLPSTPSPLVVTCETCHRGVPRPVQLSSLITEALAAGGADSAIRAYRVLRERYLGRGAYDFSEATLNTAAFRGARAGRTDDALRLLALNDSLFPAAFALHISRGNVHLMRGDTTAAAASYREALRRDPGNDEALGRLRTIKRVP